MGLNAKILPQFAYYNWMPPPLGLQAEQLSLRGSHGLRCGNVRCAETSRESGGNGLTRIATNSGIGLAFLHNKLLPTLTFTDFLMLIHHCGIPVDTETHFIAMG